MSMDSKVFNKDLERVEILLPKHLVKWLYKYADETALKPDQFITQILELYYDVWRIGVDSASSVGENIHRAYRIYCRSFLYHVLESLDNLRNKHIVEKFINEVCENSIDLLLLDKYIDRFLNNYTRIKNLKKNTVQNYRSVLYRFVRRVNEIINKYINQ